MPQPFPDKAQRRERIERQNEQAVEFLENLSNASAGRFYRSEISDIKKNFALIADELRNQYCLGFYPDGEKRVGTAHKLRVAVSQTDVVIRARRTYTDWERLEGFRGDAFCFVLADCPKARTAA